MLRVLRKFFNKRNGEFNRNFYLMKKKCENTYQDVKFNHAGIITQIVEKKTGKNEVIPYRDLEVDFSYLYNRLGDKESKRNLLKVALYFARPEYPVIVMDKNFYNRQMASITKKGKEFYNLDLNDGNAIIDLAPFGVNFKLLTDSYILFSLILNDQYEIKRIGFEAKNGDYVLDCGACGAETSLYFATKVGPAGKVFAFEAVDQNIVDFERNTGYNPHLQSRIDLVQNFVSDKEEVVFVSRNYAASSVVNEENDNTVRIDAIRIDDFVRNNKISRVDFIKMDIEGSELKALMGAQETIKKFRPKMAICLYHKRSDYYDIPKYLMELGQAYKYYLSVNHPLAVEVVLHCAPIL